MGDVDSGPWASATAYGFGAEMMKTDGTLWTWASGGDFPTQFSTATNWVSVASGSSHTLAIARP
jgi:hypothetical protein